MFERIRISSTVAGTHHPSFFNVVAKTATVCLDPKRFAWASLNENGAGNMHLDGSTFPILGGLGQCPVFSHDGSRFGYILNLPKHPLLVVDGIERQIRKSDWATDLVFSSDGSIEAFASWRNKHKTIKTENTDVTVVIGQNTYGPYNTLSEKAEKPIVFSLVDNHYGFFAFRNHMPLAIIDGMEYGPYEGVTGGGPTFSEDGRRYAYSAQINGQWAVIDSGRQGELFDGIISNSLSVARNGTHVAYGAGRGNDIFFVVDNEIHETTTERYIMPRISPDGSTIAKISSIRKSGTYEVEAGNWLLNRHDKSESVNLLSFTWSPDSHSVAYLCHKGEKCFVMVNNKKEDSLDAMLPPGIVFSHDGKHHAYFAEKGGSTHLVIDGVMSTDTFGLLLPNLRILPDGTATFAEISLRELLWVEGIIV
jgi:hypothetical protein